MAYVIYTSGTTGQPKGVMIDNETLYRFIVGNDSLFLESSTSLLSCTNYTFDIFGLEIFLPFFTGGSVILSDMDNAAQSLITHGKLINCIQLTPGGWEVLFEGLQKGESGDYSNVHALVGGDKVQAQLLEKLQQCFNNVTQVYGPTETCIWSTSARNLTEKKIGKPLANEKVYVLNGEHQLVPVGTSGELYIGGVGVARGYLNRDEMTNERFLKVPLGSQGPNGVCNQSVYRTGDQVRWLPDGNLEYLGRNDSQVKIRGHRIELGEIENALLLQSGIKQAVVIDVINTQQIYLVAYVVPENLSGVIAKEPESLDSIRKTLAKTLPDYMVPSSVIQVDEIPLNINGKIDRKRLPEPNFTNIYAYTPPQNESQEQLCEIWKDILELTRVGIEDNFFRIGGNSILAIRLSARIRQVLGLEMPLSLLFSNPTVSALSEHLEGFGTKDRFQAYRIEQSQELDTSLPFPINNVQQAYLIGREQTQQLGGVATHVYSELSFTTLDVPRLEFAINKCIIRHDALRSVFEDGEQRILNSVPDYSIVDYGFLSDESLDQLRAKWAQHVYEPSIWPLFHFSVSCYNKQTLLHVSVDSLILDGISTQILFREISLLYSNPYACLPELKLSYRDYAIAVDKIRQSELYLSDKEWWQRRLGEFELDLSLPLLNRPEKVNKPVFRRVSRKLDSDTWAALKEKANLSQISPTSVVLYAYGLVLSRWSGQSNLCINLTLFNRLPIHSQINDIVGETTALELFAWSRRSSNILEALSETNRQLWEDIEHNLFDGVDLQRMLREQYGLPAERLIAPCVLTSMLGESRTTHGQILPGMTGIHFSITQTPQVIIDNKALEENGQLVAEWDYPEQLFSRDLIEEMHSDYCEILELLAQLNWGENKVSQCLPNAFYDEFQFQANKVDAEYPNSHLLSGFEHQLQIRPDANIVIDHTGACTYRSLDLYRRSIAGSLLNDNEKPTYEPTLVAILCEKGRLQFSACLGVLSAGMAYLPLHVDWPAGRICEVLAVGNVSTVLMSASQQKALIGERFLEEYQVMILDELIQSDPVVYLPEISSEQLAYVIFTSGSTGKPKGVQITHGQAMNTIEAVNRRFSIGENDKVLAISELIFDLSVWDMFGVSGAGGCLVYPQQQLVKEPSHWTSLIEKHRVTIWNSVPQLMQLLVEEVGGRNLLSSLNTVLLSGDRIPLTLPDEVKSASSAHVFSLGGVTEGSIWSIWYEIGHVDLEWQCIPYGVAMPNQSIWVLNDEGECCPIGVSGEICIGGKGVALGYTDPERTAQQFIEHPTIGRVYKTGDSGAWHSDGYVEFRGRKDDQVKINGYRVELGELTSRLSSLAGIKQACSSTIKAPSGGVFLVSWVEPEEAIPEDKTAFRLAQHGLRKDLAAGTPVNLDIDIEKWLQRKSYRQFNPSTQNITKVVEGLFYGLPKSKNSTLNGQERLIQWLSVLSAVELDDRALPKYRYPSAGSSYAIRIYVCLAEGQLNNLPSGRYYFHPVEQSLHKVDDEVFVVNQLEFRAEVKAIEPLYSGNSHKYLSLELGHILSLLDGVTLNQVVPMLSEDIEGEEALLLKLPVDIEPNNSDFELSVEFYTRSPLGWVDNNGNVTKDNMCVFSSSSVQGQMFNNSATLMSIDSTENIRGWVQAGYCAGSIDELLYDCLLGSCWVGVLPQGIKGQYGCVIGHVPESELSCSESIGQAVPLTEAVKELLAGELPDYMLPQKVELVERMPLTPNGKVNVKALPVPDITVVSHYIPPRTEAERKLCFIWQEVLSLHKVGIEDNFFSIGGDSMRSIQLASRLRKEGYCLQVKDIFEHPTISSLNKVLNAAEPQGNQDYIEFHNLEDAMESLIVLPLYDKGYEVWLNTLFPLLPSDLHTVMFDRDRDGKYIDFHFWAADIADSIVRHQLHTRKHCSILGWSFGSVLAHLVAVELQNKGIHIRNTFLMDPLVKGLFAEPGSIPDLPSPSVDDWLRTLRLPFNTSNGSLYQCTVGEDENALYSQAINSDALGFRPFYTDLDVIKIPCKHNDMLSDRASLEVVVNDLLYKIRSENIEQGDGV
ncbi:non-ribosomal peptide synthetase [uncultured Shewanella sp.]|uniref:non-ribosomal peptide synthetase n=1 Tax=uncultured Shewanella sp. TaxID=173975 RepID=UPI00260CEF69|nr:non-ribosomal peptide synthetase [uncultured Shewanella sp.]